MAASSLGCSLELVASTEVAELCVVGMKAEFQSGYGMAVTDAFDDEDLGLDWIDELDSVVVLEGMGGRTRSGIDTFDFVEHLRITMSSEIEGVDLPEVVVLDVDGADEMSGASDWYSEAESAVDVGEYFREGPVNFRVEFTGTLPATEWAIDVDACFFASFEYRRGLADKE